MARPARTRRRRPRQYEGLADEMATRTEGIRLMVRVAFGRHGALGPGKMRLLELIDERGSIAAASRAMGMSYRRAWLLINGLQAAFAAPAVETRHGGARGGSAGLTPFGRELMRRYRVIENTARDAVGVELAALERDLFGQGAGTADDATQE